MLLPRNTSRLFVRPSVWPTDRTAQPAHLISTRLDTTQADAAAEALSWVTKALDWVAEALGGVKKHSAQLQKHSARLFLSFP
jgi:hypothetical protein